MRFFIIDLFKAIAAQLIVLHHLVAYGPVAHAVGVAVPALAHWLYDYARMAVQIFLVVGGYLAARSFEGPRKGTVWSTIRKRYLRLVVPFLVALLITTLVATLVRPGFIDEAMPAVPTLTQVLAHVFLLHGVLDYESLSAGVWYVAIDFQLYVLFALLAWYSRHALRLHLGIVIALTLASLFHFNRDSGFDDWAVYFFGAYGLGVLAFHISRQTRPMPWLGLLLSVSVAALWLDYRGRIFVALCVALALVLLRNIEIHQQWPQRIAAYFGTNSYALFLVHFSLCLAGNAIFVHLGWESPLAGVLMLVLVWISSNLLAHVFYRCVEHPASRLH